MIIDLRKFIDTSQPRWRELEELLNEIQSNSRAKLTPEQAFRLYELYEYALSDTAAISTFATEQSTHDYLSQLTSRAYAEIHETRSQRYRTPFRPLHWLKNTLPSTFRKHIRAFRLSLIITVVGSIIGGAAVALDPSAKEVIMPFHNLLGDPSERVSQEESRGGESDYLQGRKAHGSAWYMTHNTRVSIFTLGLGVTYGIGTVITLFYNGIILGAVAADYLLAGEGVFLIGWLLPHGSVEIPAIIIAGQAGFILAGALIGFRKRQTIGLRVRKCLPDVVTLAGGFTILLIWAGIIEAFFSQYHAPILPYSVKITFGAIQLLLLVLYLTFSGRTRPSQPGEDN